LLTTRVTFGSHFFPDSLHSTEQVHQIWYMPLYEKYRNWIPHCKGLVLPCKISHLE